MNIGELRLSMATANRIKIIKYQEYLVAEGEMKTLQAKHDLLMAEHELKRYMDGKEESDKNNGK